MYKITLYDANCSPICDGTVFWFVENLEEFEENWLMAQVQLYGRIETEQLERYYRSKLGEATTDYYSDSADLNIVQQAESEFLSEKTYRYKNKIIELENVYGFRTSIEFESLVFELRVMKYDGRYYLVGQYQGTGCKRIEPTWNRWYEKETKYASMHFYGNPIVNYRERYINWDDRDRADAYKDFYTNDKEFFSREELETFVWIPIKEVEKDYKIKALTKNEIKCFMADIVGEAG